MRLAYELAACKLAAYQEKLRWRSDEGRVKQALDFAGGEFHSFEDRGDYWRLEWSTRDGKRHNSAIQKRDLTVISAGICLDGHDRNFDLQSLVGVVERAPDWA